MNFEIKRTLRRIASVLILLAVIVNLLFWQQPKIGLSYALGSVLAFGNFFLMALAIDGFFQSFSMAKKFGNFTFRFGGLLVISIVLTALFKLHIIGFGCGLISVQAAIYLLLLAEIAGQKIQKIIQKGRSRYE